MLPELRERLKQIRLSRGFATQGSFAEALTKYMREHQEPDDKKQHTVSRQQVADWEGGKYTPGALALATIASVLDVSTDYLLGIVDDPKGHLEEEGLSDDELKFVRRLRQYPELFSLLYKLLPAEPPTRKALSSSKQPGE
jgi:transcriptional regulator with XRE-family HTH domain